MLEHGGNLHAASLQYGIPLSGWLDLSTGINPYGYPIPDIPAAAWQRLPEPERQLEQAASSYYGARHLLVTAGSQAAIQILPRLRPSCRVTVLGPMYAEHAHAWRQHGHTVTEIAHLPDHALLQRTDVLLLCNPNNPTGRLLEPDTLLAWHRVLASHSGWLVVDEAFMDSTPQHSLAPASHLPGLVILRSLGKFFGLAGARVGFLLAETVLLDQAAELLGPWSVTGPAQFVAHAALTDRAWQQANIPRLTAASQQLFTLLQQYGLQPAGSCSLFQWLHTRNSKHLHQELARHGIWTRHFTQHDGLRIGLPPENGWGRLAAALGKLRPA